MRCAVLDLGSNSFHLLVADVDGNAVVPVRRQREMLHLGRAIARHGTIPIDLTVRAVATVERLSELARRTGAQRIVAVGTEALRGDDRSEVVKRLSAAAGTSVEILTGTEEARLAYLGARASVDVMDDPTLVIDLGGGSLELAVGLRDRVMWAASLPLGASRLTAMLDAEADAPTDSGPADPDALDALRRHVTSSLGDAVEAARSHGPATIIAVGGVVRALGRHLAQRSGRWLPATVNQAPLRIDELTSAVEELTTIGSDARARLPGVSSRRADHLHVGAVVLEATLSGIRGPEARVSDWGLREGLLLHRFGQVRAPSGPDLRASQVAWLRTTFSKDDPHPAHVARTALRLFDATATLHGHDARARELLDHAAHLHGIGTALTLRRQQQHGAYLLEHAELRGFDPDELALLLTLVRFHPSRGISRRYGPFAALSQEMRDRAGDLLALLQVADALDTSHDQQVDLITARRSGGVVELQLAAAPDELIERAVRDRSQLFAERFRMPVALAGRVGV
jgi:exopolyphosphatase/guanosine-5'-triphosphate,3'-diphosphate pyrophosphatase